MKQSEFRAELVKIMPGYNWTLHASRSSEKLLVATGIQSSGSNRLSTLRVERRDNYGGSGKPRYEVKSAGYGTRAPWLHTAEGGTLARALRRLQDHYEYTARTYISHAGALKQGRKHPATAPSPSTSAPQAWLDVQAERRRQVEAEGWTPEHDDEHSHGQMARAAACYALAGSSAPNDGTAALLVSLAWPWDQQWWKPTSARRDLIKAGALILAEIERLDRAAPGKEVGHE